MRRTFNYTGRKKIERKSVIISLTKKQNLPAQISLSYNLDEYCLPSDAKIYLEITDGKFAYKRYSLGTIEHPETLQNKTIDGFSSDDILKYHLKVTDESGKHGKILAIARNIVTKEPLPPTSILPVDFQDLGDSIYQVDFEYSGGLPLLVINNRILKVNIKDIVKNDPIFKSLVFPSVVKEILFQILIIDRIDEPGTETWQNKWLNFIINVCGSEYPPEFEENHEGILTNTGDLIEWINDVAIPAFCKKNHIMESFELGYEEAQ